MGRKFGFSFSAKRAFGISGAKARASRKLGIPLTRSGRQRKIGRVMAGNKCFVATACYGDTAHPTVVILRSFRDNVLRHSAMGRAFMVWYYRYGPSLAEVVYRYSTFRVMCRCALRVFAHYVAAYVGPGGVMPVNQPKRKDK